MVVKRDQMKRETRDDMKGGSGKIHITHLQGDNGMKNCRLLSEIEIPVSGSIGYHRHEGETEYFIIRHGEGLVNDDGVEISVFEGDTIITGDGGFHSVRNTGSVPLVMTAVIVTH